MAHVTLQVLDGVDRGKLFRVLPTPVTIGREEGNAVQLNDERVSRYHAKIQEDQGQLVLTDLESTNGTRINGEPVQLTIVRPGDRISLGRSILLFGSPEELDGLVPPVLHDACSSKRLAEKSVGDPEDKTRSAVTDHVVDEGVRSEELRFELNFPDPGSPADVSVQENLSSESTPKAPPELPMRLSPAQAAQLAELLLYLHQRIATATEHGAENTEEGGARLNRAAWQRVLGVQMELARYLYRIGHPE